MVDMNDDDGRRYGDWQKKDLRKNANDIIEDPNQKVWYKQTFWIIAFLFFLWPVGIVLCWRGDWPLIAKIIASIIIAIIVGYMIMMLMAFYQMGGTAALR